MSKLAEIFAHKRLEVAAAKAAVPFEVLRTQALETPRPRGFRAALLAANPGPALIAEVKKASPSQGVIRDVFDPVEIALAYRRAGAHCLSVLTDKKYFQGSPENLQRIRREVDLPLLRKDFIADAYQLFEARAWGADAILLIVAGIGQELLENLYFQARDLELDVLVEVHNEPELEVANNLGADLIGVNNRDLSTFVTDVTTAEGLLSKIRPAAVKISESALKTNEDVMRAARAGADGVLIGTAFCAADDVEAKVREVMGW